MAGAVVSCVDGFARNWFAWVVHMNVSTHKSDTHHRTGDVKKLNPDGGDNGRSAHYAGAALSRAVTREEPTDEQLLAEYRAGDKGRFAVLVLRYQRELYHFLVRFLGDRA